LITGGGGDGRRNYFVIAVLAFSVARGKATEC